jgi:tetratricopeptide (TPR) repeat protein
MPNEQAQKTSGKKLDTWKEIAAFFGRDERTVKRWEKERGLPVHRLPGGRRGTVYAFSEELTAWLDSPHSIEVAKSCARNEPRLPLPADSAAMQSVSSAHTGRPIGVGLGLAFLLLLGLASVSKLHSVPGRLLPAFSTRADGIAHKQAEDLYLQGRYHWSKRTPADLTLALDLFTKATELDPGYALGYAGKADCYNLLREYTSMPASQAFPLAITAAKKALELNDHLAEGHRALAFALFYWNWDVPAAEREFQRAIELNAQEVEAHHWYATALLALSRYPEAIEQIEQARKLDPLSSSVAADRAIILYNSGRKEEGVALLEELRTADPGFYSPPRYLAGIYYEQRNYEKYFDAAETAAKMTGDEHELATLQALRKQYETGGEQAVLKSELRDRLVALERGRGDALSVAVSYAVLGRNQEAMEYLKKAYERHDYMLIALESSKVFDDLRGTPEFQELVKRIHSRDSQRNLSTLFRLPLNTADFRTVNARCHSLTELSEQTLLSA